jgi:hypothetical protein
MWAILLGPAGLPPARLFTLVDPGDTASKPKHPPLKPA